MPETGSALQIRIETLTPTHLAAVLRIEKAVYKDPWTAASFVEVMSFSADNWVALAGDEVVGYMITQWILDEIHILNVAVAQEWHRRGVGTRLMERVVAEGLKRSMKDLFLEVRVSNAGAIALYERFGFKEITVRKKYYGDGEDALVMHCALPEQGAEPSGTSTDTTGSKTEEK